LDAAWEPGLLTTRAMAEPPTQDGSGGSGGPGHHHGHGHHHEHGHGQHYSRDPANAEPEEEVSLSASEQAHFDRIASAFHAYYHMNIKRVEKARRDFRRSGADMSGRQRRHVLRGRRMPNAVLTRVSLSGFACRSAARV